MFDYTHHHAHTLLLCVLQYCCLCCCHPHCLLLVCCCLCCQGCCAHGCDCHVHLRYNGQTRSSPARHQHAYSATAGITHSKPFCTGLGPDCAQTAAHICTRWPQGATILHTSKGSILQHASSCRHVPGPAAVLLLVLLWSQLAAVWACTQP